MLRLAWATLLLLAPAHAQAPALPSAESVPDRHVAVTGEQEAYDRVSNLTMEASWSLNGAKADGLAVGKRLPNVAALEARISGGPQVTE